MKLKRRIKYEILLACLLIPSLTPIISYAQTNQSTALNSDLKIADNKVISLQTNDFNLLFQENSQTLVALRPKSLKDSFDFVPSNRFIKRLKDGNYRIGDIDLRIRAEGAIEWQDYSTAFKRAPVISLPKSANDLLYADITPSLGNGFPLQVLRKWRVIDGKLGLEFVISNKTNKSIEVGGLGIPMIFDNIISGRHLDEAHEKASFYDPYIGMDAGYLQVTKLNGKGPALLVLPEKGTPFELYKPILDRKDKEGKPLIYNDSESRNMTFEGFYQWMVASKGFADTDWKNAKQWNEPSSFILKPNEEKRIGVRFVLSPNIRAIEDTLIKNNRPVAIGLPGYVVPMDLPADLMLKSPHKIASMEVYPKGAMEVSSQNSGTGEWKKFHIKGKILGDARLEIKYTDGSLQTIHYNIVKPQKEILADLGKFSFSKSWYENKDDKFGRSPSIMTYDNEAKKIVTSDSRVWVSGLSDEGGAGAWLAAIMKQLDNPNIEEVTKFEEFANKTLWGKIQTSEGEDKYGVRKSVFYYDPDNMPAGTYDADANWKTWSAWNKKAAADLGRSYNYPHVSAAWWVLYRLGRYQNGIISAQTWQEYLIRSGETIKAMMTKAPYYTQFGQMEGDVFVYVLDDLKREGATDPKFQELANEVEKLMKSRADHWNTIKYPFGSEMPWDSTGQAEVYMWMKYFNFPEKLDVTREVILAYDPLIPHWGYNGSARRFWDFLYAGKLSRIERQLHHYGSSLNAVPLFDAYRSNPEDVHLLRVAYGGLMGSITNIDKDGFGSAAFHSFPDAMKWDAITGDYGMSLYGHIVASASYLVKDKKFGYLGFGGLLSENQDIIKLEPRDSARKRVFIAPIGLWVTLDAGTLNSVEYNAKSKEVSLFLDAADANTANAYLNLQNTINNETKFIIEEQIVNGAYKINLGSSITKLKILSVKK